MNRINGRQVEAKQGPLDALKQFAVSEWFGEKIYRSCLHRSSAHWDVAMTGNEDELFLPAALN